MRYFKLNEDGTETEIQIKHLDRLVHGVKHSYQGVNPNKFKRYVEFFKKPTHSLMIYWDDLSIIFTRGLSETKIVFDNFQEFMDFINSEIYANTYGCMNYTSYLKDVQDWASKHDFVIHLTEDGIILNSPKYDKTFVLKSDKDFVKVKVQFVK